MELFLLKECAELLGYSTDTLRVYCTRYNVGTKGNPGWKLSIDDMNEILKRKGAGRPGS